MSPSRLQFRVPASGVGVTLSTRLLFILAHTWKVPFALLSDENDTCLPHTVVASGMVSIASALAGNGDDVCAPASGAHPSARAVLAAARLDCSLVI